jgi:hypothetical protein
VICVRSSPSMNRFMTPPRNALLHFRRWVRFYTASAGSVSTRSRQGPDIERANSATQCHPLAVSVNRDEHISATRPRILSFQSLSSSLPEISAHLVLERWLRPKRTSRPSGSRPSRLAARGPWLRLQPQKILCSPPRPILAAGLASRTALWLHRSVIQRLVAHGTGATNS